MAGDNSKTNRAFSLVEVTLALGIIGFSLVGILGALPLAMDSARRSVEQTEMTHIANTLFSKFRSQPFTQISYLTPGTGGVPPVVDLSSTGTLSAQPGVASSRQFYALITDGLSEGEGVQFQSAQAGAQYGVALGFDSVLNSVMPVQGIANQIEVDVFALDHPKDIYRFTSIVARRAE